MNEAKYREAEKTLWDSVGLEPTETFVKLPRLGTTVRVQSVGEGPPALFIHGGPNSGSTWATLVEHITDFTCLLLDRPGTGLSELYPVRKNNLIDYASHLVSDVLDGLEIDSADVVASSFGGYCALWSATATPERFDRMVQMACPAMLPDQPDLPGSGGLDGTGEKGLVPRPVEHRSRVVAHPAVYGHVGADPRDDLDGAHRV